jgi:hypothetical protein
VIVAERLSAAPTPPISREGATHVNSGTPPTSPARSAGGGPAHDAGGGPAHDAGGGPAHDAGGGPAHDAGGGPA